MSEIVKVNFHGDELDCVKDGETLFVSIKAVCNGLGVDNKNQQEKLKCKPWATVVLSTMVAEDGKIRELACIALDSLPMWLATIEASRVRPELRPKLEAYQKECARVLKEYFFPSTAPSDRRRLDALEDKLGKVLDVLAVVLERQIEPPVEVPLVESGTIGQSYGDEIRARLRAYAKNMAQGTQNRKREFMAWRTRAERRLRRKFNFDGVGASWNNFPSHMLPSLMLDLMSMISDSEQVAKTRWVNPQISLLGR